jgi:hypothetical protein
MLPILATLAGCATPFPQVFGVILTGGAALFFRPAPDDDAPYLRRLKDDL